MTKESIEKIIANNRRPFAVHQLWAEFDRMERERDAYRRSVENAHAELDKSGIIGTRDKTHQGLGPRIKCLVARTNAPALANKVDMPKCKL